MSVKPLKEGSTNWGGAVEKLKLLLCCSSSYGVSLLLGGIKQIKISKTEQTLLVSRGVAWLVKGSLWSLLNNSSEDFLVLSNQQWYFVFCFLCRRRLISQRSSLETLEDIEENAPLRRSFYLLSLWLLVCKTHAWAGLLSFLMWKSSWIFTLRYSS